MAKLTQTGAWKALKAHYADLANVHMRDLFAVDPDRAQKFSCKFKNDIFLDYSKHRITGKTMGLLFDLAREMGVATAIERMFCGEKINTTEERAVLHTALRNRSNMPVVVDGEDVMPKVNAVLAHMRHFTEAVRSGEWTGCTGKAITDIVNIGIGGSDLGPRMVTAALEPYASANLKIHFVSNLDGAELAQVLARLQPDCSMFVVSSKSFSTSETMANAGVARDWLVAACSEHAVAKHFVAVSTNTAAVSEFGIDPQNMFEFWDWVGGRYSIWSAIGLSAALYVGMDQFEAFLSGAHEMDKHFRTSPFEQNLPVIMAMLGIWYINFFAARSHAVFPYDYSLRYMPIYLQQCDMESNGKHITHNGECVDYATGPVVWGKAGIDGQHSFFQLLHQGTQLVPADFIATIRTHEHEDRHSDQIMASFFSQTEALMLGRTEHDIENELQANDAPHNKTIMPHQLMTGNNPTNSIMLSTLDPRTLGMLVALYEHKVFVQGVCWDINSFDQWGVELGKKLANNIVPELKTSEEISSHDASTNMLINYYKNVR